MICSRCGIREAMSQDTVNDLGRQLRQALVHSPQIRDLLAGLDLDLPKGLCPECFAKDPVLRQLGERLERLWREPLDKFRQLLGRSFEAIDEWLAPRSK